MKIIISENQNFVLRRIQQFIDIVEDQIEGYEQNTGDPWWCRSYGPDTFLETVRGRSIEIFVDKNWNFFHDNTNDGGSDIDLSLLYQIFHSEYGNEIRNLFVRKCNHQRYW